MKDSNIYISEADNGIEALDLINRDAPALVLMDVHMPEMDGTEALRQIRANPKFENLPVIALTANILTENDSNLMELYNGYLLKPISKDMLLKEIMKHLPFTRSSESNLNLQNDLADRVIFTNRETMPEVLKGILIEKYLAKSEELKLSMFIDEIEDFAGELMHLAEEYKSDGLTDYSNRLYLECQAFNFDNIKALLNDFLTLVT